MPLCVANHALRQILEDLRDPAAYPHPVETIHVAQTHISCVFLTGGYAYKIKKPEDFGFLDYTTLERRRRFCQQEVRLNRRLCPEMYLDVVPITERGGRLRIGDEGRPVEWAVRMRQLREADMLSARLEADTVTPADIERIAQVIADFHARADRGPDICRFGQPATVCAIVRDTLRVMDRVAGGELPAGAREAIHGALDRFEREETGLLRQRMEEGCIRDCHGDLRAQNICLDARFDGGIQVFDCIEFNDAFRYIDVAADLAYLAMDLDLAGRADLRAHLIDAYERASGDTRLRRALPFYQVYRAVVRGNIALLAASEPEVPEPERRRQREMTAAYDLARCYTRRDARPALFVTVGLSGSGKSVLARELSRRLPAVLLSSDRVRKERAGVSAAGRLEAGQYTPEKRGAVYAEMRRRAAGFLRRGEHVLLDATFLAPEERTAAARLAKTQGAAFWLLDCQCPDAAIRARLRARGRDKNASDADLAVYEAQRRSYQPVDPAEFRGGKRGVYLAVNTALPPGEAARQVAARFATDA
jgi:aminoglycoside phosphotransferase family enzyme/predicted kinase